MKAETIAKLRELEAAATTSPWMYDSIANVGENWLVGVINTGVDCNGKAQHIVTTDHVHASDLDGDGPEADAKFIATARNVLPELLEAAERCERLEAALREARVGLVYPDDMMGVAKALAAVDAALGANDRIRDQEAV